MEKHQKGILAQASVQEHFRQASKDFCCAVGILKVAKTDSNLCGRTALMLSAVIAFLHLLLNILSSIRLQRFQISGYFYVALSGIMVSGLVFYSLTSSHIPAHSLDIRGIVKEKHPANEFVAFNQIDSRDTNISIPSELYPELEYIAREPLLIASSKMPVENWGVPNQLPTIKTEIKTTATKIAAVPKKVVKVQPTVGLDHVIKPGENLWELANDYGISFNKLMYYNQDINPRRIRVGQKVFIPGAKDPLPPKKKGMILPLVSVKYISSGYGYRTHPLGGGGRFHKGVDISARSGTAVRSVLDGKVVFSGWKPQLGYVVEIEHEDNLKTVYAHNRKLLVRAGQKVRQGQSIAEVGSTGRSTAPHLHFEVWKNGKHQDPLKGFLPKTMQYKYKSLARK